MEHLLKRSIVRIQKNNGQIVGAGFLVGIDQVLTCAHVVRQALNLRATPPGPPSDSISVVFPFLARDKTVTAKVVNWGPAHSEGSIDVACLKLDGFPPRDSSPLPLCSLTVDNLVGHPFSSYGYPIGYDMGVWAHGIIQEERGDGLVQLQDITVTGIRIEGGYSGGPVWDKDMRQIVGLIATADNAAETKVAFMTPAISIIKVWPHIQISPTNIKDIEIPVVVIAMNREEAESLFKHARREGVLDKFDKFRAYFSDDDVECWLSTYNEKRVYWHPHTCAEQTISDLVWEIIDEINYWDMENSNLKIQPKFLCEEFFSEDKEIQNEVWSELVESGGIVIVDPLSLFHPKIQDSIIQSQIASHDKIAILGLSPVGISTLNAYRLIEEVTESGMRWALLRFSQHFDSSCEFGVNNIQALQRWLFKILPQAAKNAENYRSNPNRRIQFRRKVNRPIMGFGSLISKGGFQR